MKRFAVYVFRRGLDSSKEVLCISVDQREAEQPTVKVEGQKKFCHWAQFKPDSPATNRVVDFFSNLKP